MATFPVIGHDLRPPNHIGGGAVGLAVGVLGSLYGGLGVAQATQNAMNTAWAVPRNSRPNPFKARGRSLLLLGIFGLSLLGTTALSAVGVSADAYGASLGFGFKALLVATAVTINAGVMILVFRVATARNLTVRDVAAGAVAGAVLWQLLQSFGSVYVGHVVKGAIEINGVFAFVLGLIAFIYLAAVAIVLCVELNVVRLRHLYPRAFLTPFTDNVELTTADRRAYTAQAQAQRTKGFEEVDVRFGADQKVG